MRNTMYNEVTDLTLMNSELVNKTYVWKKLPRLKHVIIGESEIVYNLPYIPICSLCWAEWAGSLVSTCPQTEA